MASRLSARHRSSGLLPGSAAVALLAPGLGAAPRLGGSPARHRLGGSGAAWRRGSGLHFSWPAARLGAVATARRRCPPPLSRGATETASRPCSPRLSRGVTVAGRRGAAAVLPDLWWRCSGGEARPSRAERVHRRPRPGPALCGSVRCQPRPPRSRVPVGRDPRSPRAAAVAVTAAAARSVAATGGGVISPAAAVTEGR